MVQAVGGVRPGGQRRGIFYGWWLVGLALLLTGTVGGTVSAGVGVWIKALELQFKWNRTLLSGGFSLAQMEGSLVGPLIGYLIDRLGTRRMVFIGLLIVAFGLVLFSFTRNLVTFYISFAILMGGASTGIWLPMMAALNKWFVRKRGTAMAMGSVGYAVGGVMLVPVLAWAVNPDRFGWSNTAFALGVMFLIVSYPVTRLIRNSPQEYGEHPDGDLQPAPSAPKSTAGRSQGMVPRAEEFPGLTTREALRTSAFWYITAGHSLTSAVNSTLTVHLVIMLTDQDLSLQVAAYVWAVVLGSSAVFQLVGGYIGDRFPKPMALFVFSTIMVASFGMAVLVQNVSMALLFAVIYGIGNGGRNPLSIAIRGDYFGQRAFATITGISMAPMYIGQLLAPLFAAAMFDILGDYRLAFAILAFLGFIGAISFSQARRPVMSGSELVDMPTRT